VTVALLVILVAGSLIYGRARLDHVLRSEAELPLLRVAIIQGGLEPDVRGRGALEHYLEATERVLRQGKADLIVWPEGAASGDSWLPFDLDPERNPHGAEWARKEARSLLVKAVSAWGTPLVTGGTGFSATRIPRLSNVLVVFMPGEAPRFYEKNHRLFLGEKVPFLDLMPESIQSRFENVGTLAAGIDQPKFQLGPVTFRGLICYEAVLPGYVRHCSAGVDFLCNVTEDVWYGRTAHVPQHVSVLRLRAIESRVPIVRCANMGPSGVMGMSGRFDRGARAFAPEERIVALRAGSLRSVYSQWGHFLPWILLAVPFARGAFLLARRRESPVRPAA
jgi:apolipoprotein N-acyltransferase